MPKVPSQKEFISENVQFADPIIGGAGRGNLAIAELGSAVAQISAGIIRDLSATEARTENAAVEADDLIWATSRQAQLKRVYDKGYITDQNGNPVLNSDQSYKTITQQYEEEADLRFRENQQKFSTRIGQDIYLNSARNFFGRSVATLKNDELILRADASRVELFNLRNKHGAQLDNTPSLSYLYDASNSYSGLVANLVGPTGTLAPKEGTKILFDTQSEWARRTADSVISQIETISYGRGIPLEQAGRARAEVINTWLDILDEKDLESKTRKETGLVTFSEMLGGKDQKAFRHQLLSMGSGAKAKDVSDIDILIKNVTKKWQREGRKTNSDISLVRDTLNQAVLSGGMTVDRAKDKFADFIADGVVIEQTGRASYRFDNYNNNKKKNLDLAKDIEASTELIEGASKFPYAGKEARYKAQQKADDINLSQQSKRLANAADFYGASPGTTQAELNVKLDPINVISINKNMALMRQAEDENFERFKNQNPRDLDKYVILTDSATGRIKDYLISPASSGSDSAKTELLLSYQNAYHEKDEFPRVMNQLIKKGLPERYRIFGYFRDPSTAKVLMSALENAELSKNFKDRFPDDAAKLKQEINEEFRSFSENISRTQFGSFRNEATRQGIVDAAEVYAMQLMSTGKYNRDQAIKTTKQLFYSNNFVGKRLSIGGETVIPRYVQGQELLSHHQVNIKGNLDNLASVDALKKAGITPPSKRVRQQDGTLVEVPTKFTDEFYQQVLNTGYFNYERGGFYLYWLPRDTGLSPQKVYSGKDAQTPFFIPIQDALQTPSMNPKMKQFFERYLKK